MGGHGHQHKVCFFALGLAAHVGSLHPMCKKRSYGVLCSPNGDFVGERALLQAPRPSTGRPIAAALGLCSVGGCSSRIPVGQELPGLRFGCGSVTGTARLLDGTF